MEKDELKEIIKEIMTEEKTAEEKAEKETTVDVEKLVGDLGDRLAKAIVEAKGGNSTDEKQLKEKLFNPKNGFKGIELPSSLSELENLSKEDKILTFFKGLVAQRDNPDAAMVVRALVEGTDAEGGYLVPEELRAEIWRILPDYSVMRKLARIIPMNTDTLLLNKLTAMPEAYWTAEYAQKTTSSAEFGQISLTPYKLVCLLPVTQELIADANIDIVRFIIELFAERLAHVEDVAYFTGSGTGQPTGLMGALSTAVNAGATLDFDDIIELVYKVPQSLRASRRAAFVAPSTVIKNLRKIKDTTNNYIWSPGQPDNGMVDRLYGYPLYEMNALAHNQMVFGDFSYYIIGDRQQVTVMTTLEGGDAWRRDSMEIKAKIRVDGEPIITNAFKKLINA